MALMTEERRKEMEEEMNRFELEISGPGGTVVKSDLVSSESVIEKKPLSPPPAPPTVAVLIPEVLAKVPPPPPPISSPPPPIKAILKAPPPPPPPPVVLPRPQHEAPRFIPHQLQRPPTRPVGRPGFMPMRGPPPVHMGGPPGPMGGHHGPYSCPNMSPFMHPMHQGHVGSQMPPMVHGPMPMHPGGMHMPPHMGMMPSGFCHGMGPNIAGMDPSHAFMPSMMSNFEASDMDQTSEESPVVTAAPAVYAAPFVKSQAEQGSNQSSSTNGQENNLSSMDFVATPTKSVKQNFKHDHQHTSGGLTSQASSIEETVAHSKKKEKKKKTIRMAGGQTWEDNSLLDWENDDFRIFCGDLGNDVTDEVLIRAFSKYPSFVRAKVIRDKRTNKTKGYGFVSFKDPQDFIKAMREMNGKYVGSRPIKLRKSTWRDRNIDIVKKKHREKEKLGLL